MRAVVAHGFFLQECTFETSGISNAEAFRRMNVAFFTSSDYRRSIDVIITLLTVYEMMAF